MNQLDILRLSARHAGDSNDADTDTVMKLAYLTGVAEAMADKEAADLIHVPESDPGRLTSETRSALLDALKERSGKKHRTLGMVGIGLGGLAAGAGGMHLYRKMKERKREQKKEASMEKSALGKEMISRLNRVKEDANSHGGPGMWTRLNDLDNRASDKQLNYLSAVHPRANLWRALAHAAGAKSTRSLPYATLTERKTFRDAYDAKYPKKEASIKLALGEEMARRLMNAEHRYFRPGGPKTGPNATNIVKALGIGNVTNPIARRTHLDKALVHTLRKVHESKDPERRQLYAALNHAIGAKNEVMSLNKDQIYKKLTGKDPSLMDKLLGSY